MLVVKEKDVVATGLIKTMKSIRFVANIFILKEMLPFLAKLSKTFQAGTVNYSCIEPYLQEVKDTLRNRNLTDLVIASIVKETKVQEGLGFLEILPPEAQLHEASRKMTKYIEALEDIG